MPVTETFMPVIPSSNWVSPGLAILDSFPGVLGMKPKLVATKPQ